MLQSSEDFAVTELEVAAINDNLGEMEHFLAREVLVEAERLVKTQGANKTAQPSIKPIDVVMFQLQALHNPRFEREQLSAEDARNFEFEERWSKVSLKGMSRDSSLKAHQLCGIPGLVEILDKRGRALIADEVGLGKTIQAIAVVQKLWNRRREIPDVQERRKVLGLPRPTMVAAPATLLNQWVEEIQRNFPELRILLNHSNARSRFTIDEQWTSGSLANFNGTLSRNDAIFSGEDEAAARTIVLVSNDTLPCQDGETAILEWMSAAVANSRYNTTGMTIKHLQKQWAKIEQEALLLKLESAYPELGRSPYDLSGCFNLLISDEAHKNSNPFTARFQTL